MNALINTRITYVWLLLALLTGLSWGLADGYQAADAMGYRMVSAALILLAFFKVRLVIMHFMEVATAPVFLQAIFEIWVIAVCCGILALLFQWL